MVRKITPTSGGWRKSFRPRDDHGEFEKSASRALASTSATWRENASRKFAEALKGRSLAPAMLAALRAFAIELIELETPVPPVPATSPREPIDAVAHRQQLRDMLAYKDHAEQLCNEWVDAIAHIISLITERLPEHTGTEAAASTFTAPLIDLLARPVDVVQQVVGRLLRFASDDTFPIRPGAVLAARIQQAFLRISKLTDEAARKTPHRLVGPADSGLTGIPLVTAYLGHTPFLGLFVSPVPFCLPDEQRFAGHWIIAPPGRGKTTLLHAMLLNDLQGNAS